ncbi:hypothetical protein DM819_03195 [Pseudomonas hunanensis]|uniref:Diguanylate cyclase n=1 Tax=Pseudomonas hunanensis TaxID=1247546 RepID=A0ABD6MUJ1_9PSED|nr:hypothetical protein [Pseudomonas hunanensis]POA86710.1 hypothetical protein C1882_09175 [Pseudomonas sp. FW305-E2]
MGAGEPAKQASRWLARAAPVFAGTPAPTRVAQAPGKQVGFQPTIGTCRGWLLTRSSQALTAGYSARSKPPCCATWV